MLKNKKNYYCKFYPNITCKYIFLRLTTFLCSDAVLISPTFRALVTCCHSRRDSKSPWILTGLTRFFPIGISFTSITFFVPWDENRYKVDLFYPKIIKYQQNNLWKECLRMLNLSVDKDVLILYSDIWGEYSRVTACKQWPKEQQLWQKFLLFNGEHSRVSALLKSPQLRT